MHTEVSTEALVILFLQVVVDEVVLQADLLALLLAVLVVLVLLLLLDLPLVVPASPTGGPTGGPGGTGPATGGRGYRPSIDLTGWQFWWEFNKDPFIRLRDAIHRGGPQTGDDNYYLGNTRKSAKNSLEPTLEDKLNILATLKRAMDSTNNVDITTACMIAMAKVGMNHPDFKLIDVFRPHLASKNQEVRETAALALGIAALGK
jgi:hypothetical protein